MKSPTELFLSITIAAVISSNLYTRAQNLIVTNEVDPTVQSSGRIKGNSTRPLVVFHGLLDEPHGLDFMMTYLSEHAQCKVYLMDAFHGLESLSPMWVQTNKFVSKLTEVMEQHPEGVNVLGYSQGGLLARAVIEVLPSHNIHNFISLSAPQAGQYGDELLNLVFKWLVRKEAYRFLYTRLGQLVSFANYWRDPHHRRKYLEACNFLPVVNNEVRSDNSSRFGRNFRGLANVVLVGGPDDGIIAPWQSSQFGFLDAKQQPVGMREQAFYRKDSFGLRTLDESGRLHVLTVPGVQHFKWHENASVLDECVVPFLT